MRHTLAGLGLAVIAASAFAGAQAPPPRAPGVSLADVSWKEAEAALTGSSVVVIPLGAAALQQGPHLKLNNDERLARYLAARVQSYGSVVIAPTLTYHFSPSFLEYPGSTSLGETTARDMTVDIVRSLARSGARRFYVLNTGAPTVMPLSKAAAALANDGILLGYTDPQYRVSGAVELKQSPIKVAHADEVATSIMLFVDPSAVDMKKAVREYAPGVGPMTRQKDGPGVYSESGVLGDATVATHEKGRLLVDALLAGVLEDIENIRKAPLPVPRPTAPRPPPPAPKPAAPPAPEQRLPTGCTPGDERTIRDIGVKFSYLWRQMDVDNLVLLFTANADMRHPDGTIERGHNVIRQNRRELFNKREYRDSVHPVALNDIRCPNANVAIADGKWELRLSDRLGPTTRTRGMSPEQTRHAGWCTLIVTNVGGSWLIEAWRYTVNPPDGVPPPTTLKQPGFLGRGGGL